MKDQTNFRYIDDDFESYITDGLGIIKIKNNVFEIVTDIPESSKFLDTLDYFEHESEVTAIMVINEDGCLGNKEYKRYLNSIFKHTENEGKWSHVNSSQRITRTREIVILNNIIKKFIKSSKLIIAALNGEIVTPFFGASLAMDLRLASSNVSFKLSHIEMNLHPTGALTYFLPKYLAHAQAANILYGWDTLSLDKAYNVGLISEIIPADNFEETVMQIAEEKIKISKNVMGCTKKLLNSNFSDLEKYLNLEECDFHQK